MAGRYIIETARLALRQASRDDAGFMLQLLNEPSWRRFIGNHTVETLESAAGYIEERYTPAYKDGLGLWIVELRENQVPIGICGLLRRDYLEDIDLGFAFLEAYWGRGYARESSRAVLDYARSRLQSDRVLAITVAENGNSTRLLHRLGFVFSHQFSRPDNGEILDLYALQLAPAPGRDMPSWMGILRIPYAGALLIQTLIILACAVLEYFNAEAGMQVYRLPRFIFWFYVWTGIGAPVLALATLVILLVKKDCLSRGISDAIRRVRQQLIILCIINVGAAAAWFYFGGLVFFGAGGSR